MFKMYLPRQKLTKYEVCSKSIETVAVFTETKINNE